MSHRIKWAGAITGLPVLLSACGWTAANLGLATGSTASLLIDRRQTMEARSRGLWEGNPIIGPTPSQAQIDRYTAGAIVLNLGIASVLPKDYRNAWFGVVLGVEALTIWQNAAHFHLTISF